MHFRRYAPLVVGLAASLPGGPAMAQAYYGSGSETTGAVPLSAGRVTVELDHDGRGRFAVRVAAADGEWRAAVIDTVGSFAGTREIEIPRAGEYRLEVTASEAWMARLIPADAAAREADPSSSAEELRAQARFDADRAARAAGGVPYLVGGLVGGTLLGPIGAGVAFAVASGRDTPVPPRLEAELATTDPAYAEAFRETFPDRLRSARKVSAITGGVAGSMVFFFLLVQLANWDADGGAPGPGPGDPVATVGRI